MDADDGHRAGDDLAEALLDHLPVALLVTTPGGLVLQASIAACELLGHSRVALEHRPLVSAVPLGERRRLRDAISRLERGEADGEELHVRLEQGPGGAALVRVHVRRGTGTGGRVLRWVLSGAAAEPATPAGPAELTDLQAALAELTAVALSRDPLEEVGRHVSRVAVRAVEGATAAGVMLLERRGRTLLGSSSMVALAHDRRQQDLAEGPSLEALASGRRVVTGDLARELRWPRLARSADGQPLSVLAQPLLTGDEAFGVLSVYAPALHAFGPAAVAVAEQFAQHAGMVVHDAQTIAQQRRLIRRLFDAVASRTVVDQAIGALIGANGWNQRAALEHLRRRSRLQGIEIRQAAEAVLTELGGVPEG